MKSGGSRLASLVRLELRRWTDQQAITGGLLSWIREYLPDHCDRPFSPLHAWLADELDRSYLHRGRKIALVGPRGSAKSTICTMAHVLRSVLDNSEPYVWILSDTKTQAETHLNNIRQELMENVHIRASYGYQTVGSRATLNNNQIKISNGCVIEAYGTGQALRGRRRGAHRPTLIVCDDLQNDSHVVSALRRDSTREWFRSTLLPAGRQGTNFAVLGTALHRECIAVQQLEAPGWIGRRFSAIIDWPKRMDLWGEWELLFAKARDHIGEELAREFYEDHREEMDEESEVLWPSEESLYNLMKLRAEVGTQAFEREKQGLPVDPERCEWPSEYFDDKVIWFDEFPRDGLRVMTLDPSKGKHSRKGDYSALVSIELGRDGNIYVDCDMRREPVPKICERVVEQYQYFLPSEIGVESNQFQDLICNEIERCVANVGGIGTLPIRGILNEINKEIRIRRLGTWLSRRRLRFRAGSQGAKMLVDQLRDFPMGSHDDGPDALEMGIRVLDAACGRPANEVVLGRV